MSPRFGRGEPRPDDTLLAATVDVLAGTLGLRDGSTGDHSSRVVELAQRIGEKLGLERRELRDLVGVYENDYYGRCEISLVGGGLQLAFGPARYRAGLEFSGADTDGIAEYARRHQRK